METSKITNGFKGFVTYKNEDGTEEKEEMYPFDEFYQFMESTSNTFDPFEFYTTFGYHTFDGTTLSSKMILEGCNNIETNFTNLINGAFMFATIDMNLNQPYYLSTIDCTFNNLKTADGMFFGTIV